MRVRLRYFYFITTTMNKNKWLLITINLVFLISPWVVGQLVVNTLEGDPAQGAGMTIFLSLLVLTPALAILGLLVTILTRKSKNAFRYSMLSFGIPAILIIVIILMLRIGD